VCSDLLSQNYIVRVYLTMLHVNVV